MDWIAIFYFLMEIGVLTLCIHPFVRTLAGTKAMNAFIGLCVSSALLFALVFVFQPPILTAIAHYFSLWAVPLFILLFHQELRSTFAKVGIQSKKFQELGEFDIFLEDLARSVYRLSDRRIGALLIIENQDALDEFAAQALLLNARFSSELLETLFTPDSPLHDGAAIIRGSIILSAATILPLAELGNHISKSMGTRHRAGLGISQRTDALVIMVSEETGKISVARDGIMTQGVKRERFKAITRSVLTSPSAPRKSTLAWRFT